MQNTFKIKEFEYNEKTYDLCVETFPFIFDEIEDEVREHLLEFGEPAKEIQEKLKTKKHCLNVDVINAIQEGDCALGITLRLDNKVIGYTMGVKSPFLHCTDVWYAAISSFFIVKEHRGSWVLPRALLETFEEIAARVWNTSYITCNASKKDNLYPFLVRCGYQPKEIIFVKGV